MILSIDYISIKKNWEKTKQTKRLLQAGTCKKIGQPGKTGKILKKYNLSRLNQEEI